jgi:hypothetical protein
LSRNGSRVIATSVVAGCGRRPGVDGSESGEPAGAGVTGLMGAVLARSFGSPEVLEVVEVPVPCLDPVSCW